MREYVKSKVKEIKALNEISLKDEIVVFGSSYMSKFPFYELVNKCHFENAIYNRSIDGLTISEAKEIFNDCVVGLHPSKLFISLGEEDKDNIDAIKEYKEVLNNAMKSLPNCQIYLIGLDKDSESAKTLNQKIKGLCNSERVEYVELVWSKEVMLSVIRKQFKQLSRFFRTKSIDFTDAFEIAYV